MDTNCLQRNLALIEAANPSRVRGPVDAARIRLKLGMTQRAFAATFGFPVATLRHWEAGSRIPSGSALLLLKVIANHPRAVITVVRKLRRDEPGVLPPAERRPGFRAPRPAPARRRGRIAP